MTTPEQQQRIAELAYRIWEQQGRPEGRDREHWEQARRQLQGSDAGLTPGASQPEPAPTAPTDNAVLARPQRLKSPAQVTPGVVKDGRTRRARRPD
jgi:hypothetical protein